MSDDSANKIHIDSDWKAQAQAEKERLAAAEQEKAEQAAPAGGGRGLPEPNFRGLVGVLATQAIMGLGGMVDQETNRVMIDLEGAKFSIELLGVIEEKTKGNLDEEEAKELSAVLHELRSRFVEVTQLIAQQQAGQAAAGGAAPGDAGGGVIHPG